MGARQDYQRQRGTALPLLIFAAIDLVLALFLLLGSGLSVAFFLIFAIGTALAAIGLVKIYRHPPDPDTPA